MAVLGGGGVDLRVDAVKEITRACVRGLMTDVNVLIPEETCLGSEFRAQLGQGIAALADPQFLLQQNQPFRTVAQGLGGYGGWEKERRHVEGTRILVS